MKSLATRSHEEEQMDAETLAPEIYNEVLRDLVRVNRWTLAARPTLNFLARAAGRQPRLRILDVGFGGGDMLRTIWRWSERKGLEVELVGVDINPKSAAIAGALTPRQARIRYHTGDYRGVPGQFDVVISNLVAHHMSDGELQAFVRFMEDTGCRGWMINDLHRHRLAYVGYPWLARLLGVHPIVRQDGRLSIARAFRESEWRELLGRENIRARIVRRFPFRLCVERLR